MKVPLCTETLRFKKLLEIKVALLTITLILLVFFVFGNNLQAKNEQKGVKILEI